jgi:hypothetical protein
MGRYYYGDIEGKFWFAVQPSDSADRFGKIGYEPSYLEYYFEQEDLEQVQKELTIIENNLGSYMLSLDNFFNENGSYNDNDLVNLLGISLEEVRKLLKDYADYKLGKKIEQSILEKGECSFTAEL